MAWGSSLGVFTTNTRVQVNLCTPAVQSALLPGIQGRDREADGGEATVKVRTHG